MRARYARQIRAGITVARMAPSVGAIALISRPRPQLTVAAYKRESNNVLRRILRHCIRPAELKVSVDLTEAIHHGS